MILYFEEQDYQEWLDENPDGDRTEYACEVATYSMEIMDEIITDSVKAAQSLPEPIRPDADQIKSWLTVPKCI